MTRSVSIVAPKGNLAKGSYALNNKLVASKGKWTAYKTAASPTKKGQKSADKNAKKSAKVYGSQLSLTFTRAPRPARSRSPSTARPTIYDLYAQEDGQPHEDLEVQGRAQVALGLRHRARQEEREEQGHHGLPGSSEGEVMKNSSTRTGNSMNRRLLRTSVAGGMVAALAIAGIGTASADPNPEPGTPPAGKTPSQIYAGVGADAFAELTNNVMVHYNAETPAPSVVLASYDSINPITSAANEQITTKPGCSIVRPNGANAGDYARSC